MEIVDFRERPLLFIDLEMTGLNPLTHEIIEVGAVVVNGRTLEIEKEYEVKVAPQHIELASPEALEVNGYTSEAWKDAKPLREVLEELNKLAPGGILAGWNVWTDAMFLKLAYVKEDLQWNFDYHVLDVIPLAWKYAQTHEDIKELRLSAVCSSLGISREVMHRALADIKATVEVFKKLIQNSNLKTQNHN